MINRLFQSKSEAFLFAVLFVSFGFFYQGGFSNQNSRYDLALALVYDGTYAIDSFHTNTIDKVKAGEHFYLEKSPLLAYLALPAAAFTRLCVAREEFVHSEPLGDLSLYLATLFSVGLFSALAAVLFFRLLATVRPGLDEKTRLALALLAYLGTLLFPYSTVLFGHAVTAGLGVAFLGAAHGALLHATARRYFVSGLLAGLVVVSEFPCALLVAPLAMALCVCGGRWSLFFILGAGIPGLGLLAHNWASFGSPFQMGYGQLHGSPFETGMGVGLFGISWPRSWVALELLFGAYRGLLVYSPALLLAILGYVHWIRDRKSDRLFCLGAFAGCAALVLGISGYSFWQGGPVFGPRHLVPLIPWLALGWAFAIDTPAQRRSLVFLGVLSVGISLAGTAVYLFPSEQDFNPLANFYLPSLANGHVAMNPNSFLTGFYDQALRWQDASDFRWSAWNWGEVLGLHGIASLLVLLGIWIATGMVCFRQRLHLKLSFGGNDNEKHS